MLGVGSHSARQAARGSLAPAATIIAAAPLGHPITPLTMRRPPTPKQLVSAAHGRSPQGAWYRYYAGYSERFVQAIVRDLKDEGVVGPTKLLADPWNGAGTTTRVAEQLDVASWGGDLNPAMVVIAKAQLLGNHVTPSEIAICEGILKGAKSQAGTSTLEEDPLRLWFRPSAAAAVRSIEQSISALLDPNAQDARPLTAIERINDISPLAAFFYLALFKTTRELLSPFVATNPTWLKRPDSLRSRLAPNFDTVAGLFRAHARSAIGPPGQATSKQLRASAPAAPVNAGASVRTGEHAKLMPLIRARLEVASSRSLPLDDASVSAVLSSPPYCTRIDYAVATIPELATLGLTEGAIRSLRERMIGTSTVAKEQPPIDSAWGKTCGRFLRRVARHPSKASKSYYLKNHLQYFDGLGRSLRELHRVLEPEGSCVLVVQDSYYKKVHNDLPKIVSEMGIELGWKVSDRYDYSHGRHMARVNKNATRYSPIESVLVFHKSSPWAPLRRRETRTSL